MGMKVSPVAGTTLMPALVPVIEGTNESVAVIVVCRPGETRAAGNVPVPPLSVAVEASEADASLLVRYTRSE
jgi:hypothetical protein